MRGPKPGGPTRTASVRVGVVRLAHGEGLALPAYQSDEAAGLDLLAAVAAGQPMTLRPGERALVPTGLVLELPKGTEAQVRPRSGLALKHGITVLNSPGTIDSDYRGEVKVLLVNLGTEPFEIKRGERIAQMVIATVARAVLEEQAAAKATRRGAGGFGSTGATTMPARRGQARVAPRAKAPAAHSRPRTKKK